MSGGRKARPYVFDKPELDLAAEIAAEEWDQKKAFLEAMLRRKGSLMAAVRYTGTSRRTVMGWVARDPDFAEQYQDIREEVVGRMEQHIIDIADDETVKPATRLAAAAKILEAYRPEYSKKHDSNVHDNNVTINLIIDEPNTPLLTEPEPVDAKFIPQDAEAHDPD